MSKTLQGITREDITRVKKLVKSAVDNAVDLSYLAPKGVCTTAKVSDKFDEAKALLDMLEAEVLNGVE